MPIELDFPTWRVLPWTEIHSRGTTNKPRSETELLVRQSADINRGGEKKGTKALWFIINAVNSFFPLMIQYLIL